MSGSGFKEPEQRLVTLNMNCTKQTINAAQFNVSVRWPLSQTTSFYIFLHPRFISSVALTQRSKTSASALLEGLFASESKVEVLLQCFCPANVQM
jgi:hypothetical protein